MIIQKDKKNELMNRREVQVIFEGEKVPSYSEAAKIVADNFKSDEGNIMVEQVKGTFGKKTFSIKASIYDTKELKEESVKRLTKIKKAAVVPAA